MGTVTENRHHFKNTKTFFPGQKPKNNGKVLPQFWHPNILKLSQFSQAIDRLGHKRLSLEKGYANFFFFF